MKKEIYEKGLQWDEEIGEAYKKDKNNLIKITIFLSAIIVVLLVLLIFLFPLKKIETVTIVVDKNSGNIEVVHTLTKKLEITALESVKRSLLSQYVGWYKTYDESDITKRSEKLQLFSTSAVYAEFAGLYSRKDDKNPNVYFSANDKANVEVLDIIVLNNSTYQVRFKLIENKAIGNRELERKITATIKFKITNKDMKDFESWVNPIGLVVTSIRFDEEYNTKKGE